MRDSTIFFVFLLSCAAARLHCAAARLHCAAARLHCAAARLHCAAAVSYTHLRAHETLRYLVCRLLLEIVLVEILYFSNIR